MQPTIFMITIMITITRTITRTIMITIMITITRTIIITIMIITMITITITITIIIMIIIMIIFMIKHWLDGLGKPGATCPSRREWLLWAKVQGAEYANSSRLIIAHRGQNWFWGRGLGACSVGALSSLISQFDLLRAWNS